MRHAALIGFAAIVGVLSILFLVTQMGRLGGVSDISFEIGDGIYRSGSVEDLAPAVDEGGPLLLPDLAGGDNDVYLQHIGTDDEDGWLAIAARPQTAQRDCYVEWTSDDRTFVDNCDGTTYPEDGEGLPHYRITVNDGGDLIVDLNVVIPPVAGGE